TISLVHSTRHHRELHSFPTRRSSDLAVFSRNELQRELALVVESPNQANKAFPVPRTHGQAQLAETPVCHAPVHCAVPPALPAEPDRKSTRLNSSHVKISYAVFCLKKK